MNERIERDRRIALEILQPGDRELEHGLELHRDALVFDAYGFSPNSAFDGAALRALIDQGASTREVLDLMEEGRMTRHVFEADARREYTEAWEASGVDAIFQNAGVEGQAPQDMIKRLGRFTFCCDMLRGFLRRSTVPGDVEAARAAGERTLVFTTNGVPLPQRWDSPEEELGLIRVFFQLGVRMMHLTYNRRNMIGDGCGEETDAGLSDFGRAVVREMNRVGVIPDGAHSGVQTGLSACDASDNPVVISHAVCAALNEHCRAKPDALIRAVADTGGYMGICAIPRFLGRSHDIAAFLDHIEHVARLVGPDHVAIGTDVAYVSSALKAEQEKMGAFARRAIFGHLWPPGALSPIDSERGGLSGPSLAWTNWPLFTVGLVQRGWSDDDIRKVLGGNVLRVLRDTLPEGLPVDAGASTDDPEATT